MAFAAHLFRAVDLAGTILLDGDECDQDRAGDQMILRRCDGGGRAVRFGEQTIEIDSDGVATAIDVGSQRHELEFRVSRPLAAADLH